MFGYIKKIRNVVLFLFYKNQFKHIGYPVMFFSNYYIENYGKISFSRNITVPERCFISPIELEVGENTWLGLNSYICGKVKIGANVMIGHSVVIPGANHNINNLSKPMIDCGITVKGTVIEDDVWIGANSVILDGITIGHGAVIGAGSIVTKDIPPFAIAIGNPARVVRYRNEKD